MPGTNCPAAAAALSQPADTSPPAEEEGVGWKTKPCGYLLTNALMPSVPDQAAPFHGENHATDVVAAGGAGAAARALGDWARKWARRGHGRPQEADAALTQVSPHCERHDGTGTMPGPWIGRIWRRSLGQNGP
jgi:hypothetical protein